MPKKLRTRGLIYFMNYPWNGEKCALCGGDPIYKVGEEPLCSRCMDEVHLEGEHEGMIYNPYTGRWSWI